MRRIILTPTGKPPVIFTGRHVDTFRKKVGCSRFSISVYATRKPRNGFFYVLKEIKPCLTDTEVAFFPSLADAVERLEMNMRSLEYAASIFSETHKACPSGTCKTKEVFP
ncbi:MAG: hypothetical protein B193_0040 [Solidesulfovibrio magneticus str. Maddingley MBC34]|uniref:Uncharacterized protein n=1 Tax=Solidesulfovibrio magneticus str. Maddingley MBC34 TaxID=1206767 RepID=K6GWA4_9BACT|nr:MAG: hypothetical protein B193_0040 [Solidesulfovibrio magneticus str. Maddingley MBC34]